MQLAENPGDPKRPRQLAQHEGHWMAVWIETQFERFDPTVWKLDDGRSAGDLRHLRRAGDAGLTLPSSAGPVVQPLP
jgi:hypothetical protein